MDYRISFGLVGGSTSKGNAIDPHDPFWDEPKFLDVNLMDNSLSVLLRIRQILITYIHENQPWMVRFTASTNW